MMSNASLLLNTLPGDSKDNVNTTVDFDAIMKKVNIVFFTIIVLLGSTGNSVVIWVAGFYMKPNITNVWLVNLAVADLIFCLARILSLSDLFLDYWPFGVFLCKFIGFFKYANMFCSVFLLAVISVDRALCVCLPMFARRHRTLCAARVVSVGVWIVAVIFSSPFFVYRQVYPGKNNLSHCAFKEGEGDISAKYVYYGIRFICGFLLPFLVILICYTLAAVRIQKTRISGKSRPLRILVVLVSAFFLCWAPYHILGLVKLVNENNKAVLFAWSMASNLAFFNSCINPVLYFCVGLEIKPVCNQSLSGILHRALMEEGQNQFQRSSCNSFSKTGGDESDTKV